MSLDPLAVATVPADEEWDDTLDALAQAVARDMAHRGLLEDGAEDAARYHIRSFGRRLINPLLDQVRAEVQAGHRESSELRRESARLRAWAGSVSRTRRRDLRIAAALGILWTLLVVSIGALLHGEDAGTAPGPAAPAVAQPASPAPGPTLVP